MNIARAIKNWSGSDWAFSAPSNDAEYDKLGEHLRAVLDAGGDTEGNPLGGLAFFIGCLMEDYEDAHGLDIPDVSNKQIFKFLMKQHGLKQVDFPEIGSQGVVSELQDDTKDRQLTTSHIKHLASRFGISGAVFL